VGDEDRQVAEQADALLVGVSLERKPLPVEDPLAEAVLGDAGGVRLAGGVQRGRLAQGFPFRPLHPGPAAVRVLEGGEQGEVVQPVGVLRAPGLELGALGGRMVGGEALVGPAELPVMVADDPAIVDAIGREGRRVGQVINRQPAILDEPVEADQVGVAGEGGERLVRRVAIAGRAEREHLPDRLVVLGQPINEPVGPLPQIADAIAARQRGGVEQDATGTGEQSHRLYPLDKRYAQDRWPESA